MAQPRPVDAQRQQAADEGMWLIDPGPHSDSDLVPLRGYPPFEALVKPKG